MTPSRWPSGPKTLIITKNTCNRILKNWIQLVNKLLMLLIQYIKILDLDSLIKFLRYT